ncbi:unnamed protein product [Tetraodon nigroviridis]|uniref:(spotted green pufferfish) hypothetical protein n=1 Tax=Tetraodon nigroviridis TaxID=99883 RepID=Q4RM61_TETNG|nr:unnamed protein product [Tetraodon nigroviridis]
MVKAQRTQPVKSRKPQQEKGLKEKGGGGKQRKEKKNELGGKRGKDSKESHRRRRKTLALGGGESLHCCVLLTRLEEKGVAVEKEGASTPAKQKSLKVKTKLHSVQRHTKSGLQKCSTAAQREPQPKINRSDTSVVPALALEPRRRRMASLNAEAVNSLLLYRDEALPPPLAKTRQVADRVPAGGKAGPDDGAKRPRRSAAQPQDIDWLAILTPTPRRQAGLTAATLLKLTSLAYGSQRQKKPQSRPASRASSAAQGESSHTFAGGETTATKRGTQAEHEEQPKARQQGKDENIPSQMDASAYGCCHLCKSEAVDPDWKNQECLKPGRRCSPLLGFSVKSIKEEQVETEVSSCYCCTQERCLKYCHRLALLLEDKPFKEGEDGSLSESPPAWPTSTPPPPCPSAPAPGSSPAAPSPARPQRARPCPGCRRRCPTPASRSPRCAWPRSALRAPSGPAARAPACAEAARRPCGCSAAGRSGNPSPLAPPSPTLPGSRRTAATKAPTAGGRSAHPFTRRFTQWGEEALVLRRCFQGVQRDGELIQVRDTVLLKSGPRKKSLPYVAKISALWEEPESGELMMSLFWYYRPEHTQGGRNPSAHCELKANPTLKLASVPQQNEVFASRHQDVNSVACIEDKCYVLTLAQYCRFRALVKRRRDGVLDAAASLVVPPVVGNAMPTHHCVPQDVDPELVFFCRHVYDFRYGRLLKNLQ